MQRGTKHTQEAIAKIKSKSEEMGGFHTVAHTIETRLKMSKSHKGKHWRIDRETGKRVYF
ncbi:MAG: hypothetical protein MJZ20_09505 [Bacteroidaceae bacterium]|nr:hypothetical protein [Bacteroidaceae bacterium]